MATTGVLWATGTPAVSPGGSWTSGGGSPTNAVGPNDGVQAQWGFNSVPDAVSWIEPAGFGAQTAIGTEPGSIDQVAVTVWSSSSNTSRIVSITAQLTSSGTPIGSPQSLTGSTSTTNFQTLNFTGVTWADLANLGVRVTFTRYSGGSLVNARVDTVAIDVTYTEASGEDHEGSATLSGDGTLSVASTFNTIQTANLSGDGSFGTSAHLVGASAQLNTSGAGQFSAASSIAFTSTIEFSGVGQFSSASSIAFTSTTEFSGAGSLATAGVPNPLDSLTLSGLGSL